MEDSSLVLSRDMTILMWKIGIFDDLSRFEKYEKIEEIVHQNDHISAPDKARTFHESSLKSSNSGLSRGSIHCYPEAVSVQKNCYFSKRVGF